MNIYEKTISMVRNGAKFSVDLNKRNLILNKKFVIKNGKFNGDLGLEKEENIDIVLSKIESLYDIYFKSVPTERSEGKQHRPFFAPKYNDMTDDEIIFGVPRDHAQVELELYVLCSILNGSLFWSEEKMGKNWFWQSNVNSNLTIYKDWVVNPAIS